jgi:hypothetical protein
MSAAAVPPRLPGTSVSRAGKVQAILFGALALVGLVPLAMLQAIWSGEVGGSLPWPAVQWALTTPLGALLVTALCTLVFVPSCVLPSLGGVRREVAWAIDITDLSPAWGWPSPWPTYPRQPLLQRWLGQERRERALSLALLALGALLAAALVGAFFGSTVYGLRASDARIAPDGNGCLNGCPPSYPLIGMVLAGWFAAMALSWLTRALWLRRVEARGHVWLRYRSWLNGTPLYYVRQPGVTPEAAAAALARFSSARRVPVPWARTFFIVVLASTPYVLLASVSFALSGWLQLQWIPGWIPG